MYAVKAKGQDFFAQAGHIDTEGVLIDETLILPEPLQQLFLGNHLVLMGKEDGQNLIFCRREGNLVLAIGQDTIPGQAELVQLKIILAELLGPPQNSRNFSIEEGQRKGLGNEIISPILRAMTASISSSLEEIKIIGAVSCLRISVVQ